STGPMSYYHRTVASKRLQQNRNKAAVPLRPRHLARAVRPAPSLLTVVVQAGQRSRAGSRGQTAAGNMRPPRNSSPMSALMTRYLSINKRQKKPQSPCVTRVSIDIATFPEKTQLCQKVHGKQQGALLQKESALPLRASALRGKNRREPFDTRLVRLRRAEGELHIADESRAPRALSRQRMDGYTLSSITSKSPIKGIPDYIYVALTSIFRSQQSSVGG
ncbi:hypothetical protein P4O66_012927, partial [Electrophorus voltai]